jgi:hypothetical protein
MPCRNGTVAVLAAAVLAALAACTSPAADPCASAGCPAGTVCHVSDGKAVCGGAADPCSAGTCQSDERCVVDVQGRPSCLAPDRCAAVACAADKRCDPATGTCSVTAAPCEGVVCATGKVCNPATGVCEQPENKCGKECCPSGTVCDPVNGGCVANKCLDAAFACVCGPSTQCNPVSGACDPIAPGCESCTTSQYCDPVAGRCIELVPGQPLAGQVGAACERPSDCALSGSDAFCIADGGLFGAMSGGMCSANCNNSACPSGSGCVDIGLQICLDLCTTAKDCRAGYTCTQITSDDPRQYCFPAGSSPSTCTGPDCHGVGGACEKNDDCVAGAECATGLPGGYCQKRDCVPADCNDKGENCHCVGIDTCSDATLSLEKCNPVVEPRGEGPCRAGYACLPLNTAGTEHYCYPRECEEDVDCRPAGTGCDLFCDKARGICDAPCTRNAECTGGRTCELATGRCIQNCRNDSDNCGPDGYCDMNPDILKRRCARKCRADSACSAEQFCDLSSGICKARCGSDADCFAGSFCDGSGRCRAACGSNADCGSNERCDAGRCLLRCDAGASCGFGDVCDGGTSGSGICRKDLSGVRVGAACTTALDCGAVNGSCITGLPGGYCVAPGCGDDVPCGAGAACVPFSGSKACLDICESNADCRGGYACRQASDSAMKVCTVLED